MRLLGVSRQSEKMPAHMAGTHTPKWLIRILAALIISSRGRPKWLLLEAREMRDLDRGWTAAELSGKELSLIVESDRK